MYYILQFFDKVDLKCGRTKLNSSFESKQTISGEILTTSYIEGCAIKQQVRNSQHSNITKNFYIQYFKQSVINNSSES